MLLNGGEPDGQRILSPKTVQLMTVDHIGDRYGQPWVDPEKDLIVVYFAQLIPAGGIDDHARLRALVYQAIVDGTRH
jgi:CubicO group peptidase (beta-lactamase class C family)